MTRFNITRNLSCKQQGDDITIITKSIIKSATSKNSTILIMRVLPSLHAILRIRIMRHTCSNMSTTLDQSSHLQNTNTSPWYDSCFVGNAGTVRVDIRYPRRSEFDSCAQTVQLQWNVLVHHPIARSRTRLCCQGTRRTSCKLLRARS